MVEPEGVTAMKRVLVGCAASLLLLAGCAARKSALLLERHARGPLSESQGVAQGMDWHLEPVLQTQEQGQVDVSVTFASSRFLKGFFSDRNVFGEFAGVNPFFPENIVFYVKIANRSDKRIRLNPAEFVLVDDRGNQYSTIDADYINALEEARQPVTWVTGTPGPRETAYPGRSWSEVLRRWCPAC